MSAARQVWLVRHAQTEWSEDGRHTGRTDIPLTEGGRERARELAGELAERRFARVLTSPLSRARETCELAGLAGGAEVRDELAEWAYGDYEGLTTAQIRVQRPGWWLWRDGCPGGEDAAAVGRRVGGIVDEVAAGEGDAVLFAHGHVLRVLAAVWCELAPEAGARLALSTAAVSVLGFERETRVIWAWNRA